MIARFYERRQSDKQQIDFPNSQYTTGNLIVANQSVNHFE